MVVVGCKNPHHKTRKFGLLLHPMIFDVWLLLWIVGMAEIGEFGASGAFWFWWMNYHSLIVFSTSEMVSSISSSVSLLSSILVNVRLKIVMRSSSLVIHEVNVFLTIRMLVSYLDRRLLICFNIHFLMMYLIMVEFPQGGSDERATWCLFSLTYNGCGCYFPQWSLFPLDSFFL